MDETTLPPPSLDAEGKPVVPPPAAAAPSKPAEEPKPAAPAPEQHG